MLRGQVELSGSGGAAQISEVARIVANGDRVGTRSIQNCSRVVSFVAGDNAGAEIHAAPPRYRRCRMQAVSQFSEE